MFVELVLLADFRNPCLGHEIHTMLERGRGWPVSIAALKTKQIHLEKTRILPHHTGGEIAHPLGRYSETVLSKPRAAYTITRTTTLEKDLDETFP